MNNIDTRASSEWFRRPSDQHFTDLNSMYRSCLISAEEAETRIIYSNKVKVIASTDNPDALTLELPAENQGDQSLTTFLTHWSFGQLCGLVSAPASYMRKLPASLTATNLQHGLINHRAEKLRAYSTYDGNTQLKAITGPNYGRIYDYEVIDAVRKIAGNGVDDTNWRVPGIWGKPLEEVTESNTTLLASDRDVFIFLVDEQNPIEIGKLDNGDPDIVYRGFYTWNSEVGSRSFGIATFLYREVCENRIIWGQQDFQEVTFRHSKTAPERFLQQVQPALEHYANASTTRLLTGINNAKEKIVARNEDDGKDFLRARNFNKKQTDQILNAVLNEEGHEARSVWDFVQGITAVARDIPNQDTRIHMELQANKLLKKVG